MPSTALGAPDATGQLYAFMWILSQGASRMLNVDCVCQQSLSRDERLLLDILALSQHKRTFEAMVSAAIPGPPRQCGGGGRKRRQGHEFAERRWLHPARTVDGNGLGHAFPTQEFRHGLFGEPDTVVTYH